MNLVFSLNKVTYRLMIITLGILLLTGLLSPYQYNLLPANGVLEFILILCALLLFHKPDSRILPFFICVIIYIPVTFLLSHIYAGTYYLDYLQAYKAFYYIIPLSMFLNRRVFKAQQVAFLVKILIAAFLVKYIYSLILSVDPRMGTRPGIFAENNFELIFLMILFYSVKDEFGKSYSAWFMLLAATVVLSSSRSSLLGLIIIFFSCHLTKVNVRTVLYLAFFMLLVASTAYIFSQRMSDGLESVDRFKFFMVFLEELEEWTWVNYLFGTFPLTPLSDASCKTLYFYQSLFSFSDSGECYSVILHSYTLRAIFDHGLIGLIFIVSCIYTLLRARLWSVKSSLTVVGVLLASALSVSAMNSIYSAFALAIVLSTYNPMKNNRVKTIGQAPVKNSRSM